MSLNLRLCLVLSLLISSLACGQIAIIGNKNQVISESDRQNLRDFFLLHELNWDNGEQIRVHNYRGSSDAKDIFYQFLGKQSHELNRLWLKMEITGEAEAPRALKSPKEMVETVASTEGAVGYVDVGYLTDDVQVILMLDKN